MAEQFIFDFNQVSYKEVKNLDMDNDEKMREFIARVVVKWPFKDVSPSAENIDNLGLEDFADLQVAFTERLNAMFQRIEQPE